MARRVKVVRRFNCSLGDGEDGRDTINVRCADVPCGDVVIRFKAVIDCSLGEERTPVTISFVKHRGGGGDNSGGDDGDDQEVAGQFTRVCDFFLMFTRRREVEEMVEAAGFPLESADVVEDFIARSASMAMNSYYAGVAITVEMAPPGTHVDGDDYGDSDDSDSEEEDEEAGVIKEECAICYKTYVLGGAEAVQLSCSHAYHWTCIDRWVSVKPTCPMCRSPVPRGIGFLYYYDYRYDDDDVEHHDDGDDYYPEHDRDDYSG